MSTGTPTAPTYEWRIINELGTLLKNDSTDDYSKKINDAIEILLTDRFLKIGNTLRTRYSDIGHLCTKRVIIYLPGSILGYLDFM